MIYSRWRPDTGGYDYYQTAERRGLGDDLPVPRTGFSSNAIGTASVSIGRRPQGSLHKSGSGELAKGMVLPSSKAGLSGLPLIDRLGTAFLLTGAFIAGIFFARWHTKRGG